MNPKPKRPKLCQADHACLAAALIGIDGGLMKIITMINSNSTGRDLISAAMLGEARNYLDLARHDLDRRHYVETKGKPSVYFPMEEGGE